MANLKDTEYIENELSSVNCSPKSKSIIMVVNTVTNAVQYKVTKTEFYNFYENAVEAYENIEI